MQGSDGVRCRSITSTLTRLTLMCLNKRSTDEASHGKQGSARLKEMQFTAAAWMETKEASGVQAVARIVTNIVLTK